ncbi:protein phosphatase 2C domain-containing protein [Bradyrhizobium sp. Cp5.3]|uniref:protein phosphatase 2C domain-containing protein n=1 Tax=Bradyrhizobium sp. Cp5.3 TaxID=443598 RepID=UPI000425BE07|nr:protein phosphatase 2C domain-containing protein [Bradyrhizobium sp. Cp5.3]
MGDIFERTQVELVSNWLVVGAKQGKKGPLEELIRTRKRSRFLCADEFSVDQVNTEAGSLICFAIADGVGNEIRADIGAREATRHATQSLVIECRNGRVTRHALERVLDSVHRRLNSCAEQEKTAASAFATTLLVGVLHTESAALVCASVGDAFLVAQGTERIWSSPPIEDFEPNGGTFSITDKSWHRIVRYDECPFPVTTAIAFTDGLRHVMFKVDRNSAKQITTPHEEAIQAFRQAIMPSENASRGRVVAALLGASQDPRLMEDDRTVLILHDLATTERTSLLAAKPSAPLAEIGPSNPSGRGVRNLSYRSIPRLSFIRRLRPPKISLGTERKLTLLIWLSLATILLLLVSILADITSIRTRIAGAAARWLEPVRSAPSTPALKPEAHSDSAPRSKQPDE